MEKIFLNGVYAWKDFKKTVHQFVLRNEFKDVAEIGGGANPLLSIEFVTESKLNYTIIDISEEELSKADSRFKKIVTDMEDKHLDMRDKYDFIFSQLTVEHIKDIRTFYTNVKESLNRGGCAYFFFACVTTLPTFLNYLLPDFITKRILLLIQPFRKDEKHGKFAAYYKWCFGPTKKNISRFEKLGFEVMLYTGYFGHSYYEKIPLLKFFEKKKTKLLLKRPSPYFCSYSHLLLKRR